MKNNLETIFKILPHRYPFLMVDRIYSIEESGIITSKNVSINELHFQGHFPNNPVMPGVLILEAMFQSGGLYIGMTTDVALGGAKPVLATIDKAKFYKPVLPGDQLILKVNLNTQIKSASQFTGKAYVDNTLVAEARWLIALAEL